jgi:hypothetical protein
MCGFLVEYMGDDGHVRGGAAVFAIGPQNSSRQLAEPWRQPRHGEEYVVRPAEACWRRWRGGPEYPRAATTRLWLPVDAPIHDDPAAWEGRP